MAVRLIIQSNSLEGDARLPALLKFTAATREESGRRLCASAGAWTTWRRTRSCGCRW